VQSFASPQLPRKCGCGAAASFSGECESCKKKRLHRKAGGVSCPATAPPLVHEVLNSPGRPLDPETRSFFEPRFQHDFGRVRVHTDEKAAESARAVSALAYTVGSDVAFARGRHAPSSAEGRRLLAHELTHVVQQTSARTFPLSEASAEAEAEKNEEKVVSGRLASVRAGLAAPLLQRKAGQSQKPEDDPALQPILEAFQRAQLAPDDDTKMMIYGSEVVYGLIRLYFPQYVDRIGVSYQPKLKGVAVHGAKNIEITIGKNFVLDVDAGSASKPLFKLQNALKSLDSKPGSTNHSLLGDIRQNSGTQQMSPSAPPATPGQTQALESHKKEQANVYQMIEQMKKIKADPAKGYEDPDNLLHNALEWIAGDADPERSGASLAPGQPTTTALGRHPLAVLSPTEDFTTRDQTRGLAFFDPTVKYPLTGGIYPTDPNIKQDEHLQYAQAGVHGEIVDLAHPPYIALYAATSFDYEELQKVLIHEVQHLADRHQPSYMLIGRSAVERAKERYKTEFRAFWIEPEPLPSPSPFPSGPSQSFSVQVNALNKYPVTIADPANCTACPPAGQSMPTHFKNQKQQNIFWYLKEIYARDHFDCFYVWDPDFRKMVDDFSFPQSVNLVESIRIQALVEAFRKVDPAAGNQDSALLRVLAAAKDLDNLDRQFLQDEGRSASFWTQLRQHVPADWLPDLTETVKFGKQGHPSDYPEAKPGVARA